MLEAAGAVSECRAAALPTSASPSARPTSTSPTGEQAHLRGATAEVRPPSQSGGSGLSPTSTSPTAPLVLHHQPRTITASLDGLHQPVLCRLCRMRAHVTRPQNHMARFRPLLEMPEKRRKRIADFQHFRPGWGYKPKPIAPRRLSTYEIGWLRCL